MRLSCDFDLAADAAHLLGMDVIPQLHLVIFLHELERPSGQVTNQKVWHQRYYLGQVELARFFS